MLSTLSMTDNRPERIAARVLEIVHELAMEFRRQCLDPFGEFLGQFREFRVLLHQHHELCGQRGGCRLAFGALVGQRLAMKRIGLIVHLVTIRLTRLRQQDQRRRVGRLQAERQVEEDERIKVKLPEPGHIAHDPDRHHQCLPDEKYWRAEKPRERLRLERKPVIPERRRKMAMRMVETQMSLVVRQIDGWRRSCR